MSRPRTLGRWVDAAIAALLLVGFSVEAFRSRGAAWTAAWVDACSRPEVDLHGAGEFVSLPSPGRMAADLALVELGAVIAAAGAVVAFLVAAGRSPGQIVSGARGARPITRVAAHAAAVLATAAAAGAGAAVFLAWVSDRSLSFFWDGYLRFRAAPQCVPDGLPATIGLHVAVLAGALVAGWATRVERGRRRVVALAAILGAMAGASGVRWGSTRALAPSRAACVYFVGERRIAETGGVGREIWAWNRSGSTALEALWLAGSDPAAGGARREWREPLVFRSGAAVAFTTGSVRAVDSSLRPEGAPVRRVRIDAASLAREDGTRIACVEAGALIRPP